MPIRAFLSVLSLGLFLAFGCASSEKTANSDEESDTNVRTVVEVENRSLHDLNIFAYYANQRFRLGNVRSNSTRELTLPPIISTAGGIIVFDADGVGVNSNSLPFYRQELFVTQGERVRLFIPSI